MTVTVSPARDLVRYCVRNTLDEPDGRLVVTVPPQEALKTTLAKEVATGALEQGRRVIYASYLHALARAAVREVGEHGGRFRDVAVGGALFGYAADVLLVDDPVAASHRPADADRVLTWLDQVASCRLGPGGSAVVFATRTGPRDLSGLLVERGWPILNIPVLADGITPDPLLRKTGEYLTSLRGHTPEQWDRVRLEVGERRWQTMFQGNPPEDEP